MLARPMKTRQLTVILANRVLVNDTDIEESALNRCARCWTCSRNADVKREQHSPILQQANYNGSDTFTYHANDETKTQKHCNSNDYYFFSVNDAPVAVNDAYTTNEDTPLTVALTNSVLVNDTDVEGSTLTAILNVGPAERNVDVKHQWNFHLYPIPLITTAATLSPNHANDGTGNSNITTVTTITVSPRK